ncbi:MAG: peptidase T [Oscillospiraceae bacterium]
MALSRVVQRFLRYVQIDTQSADDAAAVPSTEKQYDLARLLQEELQAMGAKDVHIGESGIVYATIPGNCRRSGVPTVGFLAHMDTSPDAPGAQVKPRIVERYDGGDIVLNEALGIVLRPEAYENMLHYVGDDLIVTDGTTLLGGDDKAGVAAIMEMAEHLLSHPEEEHGTLKLAFTTDEEVGSGAQGFDVAAFGADFAYTVDGEGMGEVNSETFSGADANIVIHGVGIHPGEAKGKMKNALLIAAELNGMLPAAETPAHTEGREGYYHLTDLSGSVTRAEMKYIIRDHDFSAFNARKARMRKIADYLNDCYGEGTVELTLRDSYYNMVDAIRPVHYILDYAKEAMAAEGLTPREVPIRGGTDGSQLTAMGLPCPNLSAGIENCHCIYEYLSVQALEKTVDILLRLARSFAEDR